MPLQAENKVPPSDPTARRVFHQILNEVKSTKEEKLLVFDGLGSKTSLKIVESLQSPAAAFERRRTRVTYDSSLDVVKILVMPTKLHEAAAGWLATEPPRWALAGLLPHQFIDLVKLLPSPTVKSFIGEYANSSKESDMTFWPRGSSYPTIVLESGWTETWPRLCEDRKLWSEGSGFAVNLIILVKIFPPNNAGVIHAKLEITSYDSEGSSSTFTESLLPCPTHAQTEYPVTYAQIFGHALPPDVAANGTVNLNIDRLRDTLSQSLADNGY